MMLLSTLRRGRGCTNSLKLISRQLVSSPDLPPNEPLTDFEDASVRAKLDASIEQVYAECIDVPIVIGGKEYRTENVQYQRAPHKQAQKLAKFYYPDKELMEEACRNSVESREKWEAMPYDARSRIFLRAASLLATKYRYDQLAACMIGQGKTAIQADIDCIAELVDFLKFNVHYGKRIHESPPLNQVDNVLNSVNWRGLEGFVAAITPFNFSAIGGNLATAPAIMGNVVIWKPSTTSIISNYGFFKILQEAGLPDGVVNFVPAAGSVFGPVVTKQADLAGITFTGSSSTFNKVWKYVGENVDSYKTYPKVIGETGGKNYHFLHESGDIESFVYGTIRSSFEYSGQKCSACSRLYVPDTMWPEVKERLVEELKNVKVGDPDDYSTFTTAVIDQTSFNNIKSYIDHAKANPEKYQIVAGGTYDDSVGLFVQPTVIEAAEPKCKLMKEEIFGPVVTAYVYDHTKVDEALELVNSTSPYGLTGSIFALDRNFVLHAQQKLRNTCGNMYLNDRSTGSVVGQQPFGGARGSGTNDKAGMSVFMQRWTSPQAVKEALAPLPHWKYPYMSS